jgi:hypothetical protein
VTLMRFRLSFPLLEAALVHLLAVGGILHRLRQSYPMRVVRRLSFGQALDGTSQTVINHSTLTLPTIFKPAWLVTTSLVTQRQ